MSTGKKKRYAYELIEDRRPLRVNRDPLEEEIRAEEEELAREARRLRLEEIVAKRKKRVKELEGSIMPEGLNISPAMAKELAKLPDEERQRVIETYIALKSAENVGGGTGALLVPLLIGYARANPGASKDSMVEFAKVMTDQIKTGIELARQNQPQQQPQINPVEIAKTMTEQVKTGIELASSQPRQPQWNPVELIKTFADLIKENVQKPMEELVQKVQPRPSALEQILLDDKLFERAKALGLFSGGQTQQTSPEIQLEIEKLRTEREMKLEEMRQQHNRWIAQQQLQAQADERRWKVVENLMQGPLGRVIQTMGGAAAAKIGGSGQPPKPILISCPKCGGTFYGSSDSKVVVCPNCNTVLRQVAEGEEEQVPPKQPEKASAPSEESKR